MSGILTQDSISLTEGLDGVRFCYLATSSRKAGTIGRSNKHLTHWDANKRADSFFLLSHVESWHWGAPLQVLAAQMLRSGHSNSALCHFHWTLSTCLKHEIEATCFPLWGGVMSSQYIPLKPMPSLTPATKHLDPQQHWFFTDSPGNKTLRINGTNEPQSEVFQQHCGFSAELTKWS